MYKCLFVIVVIYFGQTVDNVPPSRGELYVHSHKKENDIVSQARIVCKILNFTILSFITVVDYSVHLTLYL